MRAALPPSSFLEALDGFGPQPATGELSDVVREPALQEAPIAGRLLCGKEIPQGLFRSGVAVVFAVARRPSTLVGGDGRHLCLGLCSLAPTFLSRAGGQSGTFGRSRSLGNFQALRIRKAKRSRCEVKSRAARAVSPSSLSMTPLYPAANLRFAYCRRFDGNRLVVVVAIGMRGLPPIHYPALRSSVSASEYPPLADAFAQCAAKLRCSRAMAPGRPRTCSTRPVSS